MKFKVGDFVKYSSDMNYMHPLEVYNYLFKVVDVTTEGTLYYCAVVFHSDPRGLRLECVLLYPDEMVKVTGSPLTKLLVRS